MPVTRPARINQPEAVTVAGTPVAPPPQTHTSRLSPQLAQGARSSHGPEGRAAPGAPHGTARTLTAPGSSRTPRPPPGPSRSARAR